MTEAPASPWADRHPSVQHFERVLTPNPRLTGLQSSLASLFYDVAVGLLRDLKDGPELSTALRKLREAKDCAVLQSVIDQDASCTCGSPDGRGPHKPGCRCLGRS